jgi:glycerol-3-phosphate cytidylyltransferase
MKKYKIGYTQGVFDMFHIGHLNLINRAKEQCDYLIVGVNSDDLVKTYKKKETVIKEQKRAEIVRNLKAVDECIIVDTLDKMPLCRQLGFNAVFIGDDWYGNPRWMQTKDDLAKIGVDVVFLPHTEGVSSTILRLQNDNKVEE